MPTDKELNSIVAGLFIRTRKLKISLVFIINLILLFQKILYFVMKIPNKREPQQIAFNHSSDIDSRDILNIYKKCTAKLYSFLLIDAILGSDNPLNSRKNILERMR